MPKHSIQMMLPIAAFTMFGGIAFHDAAAQLYIYPAEGQTVEQQAQDEHECHGFAQSQTGIDPDNLTVPSGPRETTGTGKSAAIGGGIGAVGGGVIGAIAGNTVTGALLGAGAGAAAGAIKGNRDSNAADEEYQAAVARNQAAVDEYNRAFGACMTGKGYGVQ